MGRVPGVRGAARGRHRRGAARRSPCAETVRGSPGRPVARIVAGSFGGDARVRRRSWPRSRFRRRWSPSLDLERPRPRRRKAGLGRPLRGVSGARLTSTGEAVDSPARLHAHRGGAAHSGDTAQSSEDGHPFHEEDSGVTGRFPDVCKTLDVECIHDFELFRRLDFSTA